MGYRTEKRFYEPRVKIYKTIIRPVMAYDIKARTDTKVKKRCMRSSEIRIYPTINRIHFIQLATQEQDIREV